MTAVRISTMLRTRDVWPAVEAELQRLGVAYALEKGGKHPIVRIMIDERQRRLPISGSPRSRGQSRRKAVCQVRRVVAAMKGGRDG